MTIEYLFGVPAQFKYFKEIYPGSQFGNSVAVPVIKKIAEEIIKQLIKKCL